jgi:hypothetical protein
MDDIQCARKLKAEFLSFYQTALDYIDKWFNVNKYPNKLDWLLLSTVDSLSYDDIKETALSLRPDLANKDELFDEVKILQQTLAENDVLQKLLQLPVPHRWAKVFECHLYTHLHEIVATVLAIPSCNASVERVFSLVNIQWTDERNRLSVFTVKAIVQVLTNFQLSCTQMHDKLLNDACAQKAILSGKKYAPNVN